MSIIKRSILVVFVALILLTTIIFPASAVDTTFEFNIPDPMQNGASGYVVLPFRYSSSYIPAQCIWWNIQKVSNGTMNSTPIVQVDLSSNRFNLNFSSFDTDNNYLLSIYSIWNGTDNDNVIRVTNQIVNFATSYDFSINFPTDSYPNGYFLKPSLFSGITSFNNTASSGAFSHNVVWAYDSPIFESLTKINDKLLAILIESEFTNDKLNTIISDFNIIINHFVSLLSKVDYTNEQLETIVDKFSELLDVTYNIQSSLDDFIYVYFDTFMYQTFPDNMNAIISRLDALLRHLNKSGDFEQTTVDSSNIDNYVDIEQSLVNNDEAESAINDMDISISGKAYSFIWNLVTRIFNSHPEVFGLVIAILTLGFIALLLNR